MNKTSISVLKFILFYLAFLPLQLYGQCTTVPNPEMEIVIGSLPYDLPANTLTIPLDDVDDIVPGIPDIDICGGWPKVQVFFIPSTSNTNELPCQFTLDLDDPGEDQVILSNILSGNINDGWSIVSGQETGHAVLEYSGSFTDEIYILTLYISAPCDILNLIASGNTEELGDNSLSISGCYNNGGQDICIETTSLPFNLNYNLVSLDEGNTVTDVNLGEFFSMTKEMEVSGDYCVNHFGTFVTFADNFDLTDLEVKVQMTVLVPSSISGAPPIQVLISETLPAGSVTVEDNVACITVDNSLGQMSFDYDFCEEHFPNGMGEITMTLCSLKVVECPAGAVTWRTNSCTGRSFPAGFCEEPTLSCYPVSESTCYANVPNGDPHLTVFSEIPPTADLDFCGNETFMSYLVENTDPDDVAYGITFTANNWDAITILNVELRGINEMGMQVTNNINLLPAGVANISPTGNSVSFNFNLLMEPNFGLFDVNGDGIFSELRPGSNIQIRLTLVSDCPFEYPFNPPDEMECQSAFFPSALIYGATARWDNQCGTQPELDRENTNTTLIGPPPILVVECPGGFDIEGGNAGEEAYSFEFCIPEWTNQPNFEIPDPVNSLYVLGTYSNVLQVLAYDYPGFELLSVEFNGTTYEGADIVDVTDGWEIELNVDNLPPEVGDGNACFILNFGYECPEPLLPPSEVEPIDLDVAVYGQWSTCGDDCRMVIGTLGCDPDDDFLLYPACPCPAAEPECCASLTLESFTVERTNAPANGNRCGAYVCDPIRMVFTGRVAGNYNGQVSACFSNLLFANGLDLFSNFNATATFNGNPLTILNPTTPITTTDQLRNYSFVTEAIAGVGFSAPIEIVVTAEADQDGLENMPIFQYIIDNFTGALGEVSDAGTKKCLDSQKSAFFVVYRVDEFFEAVPSVSGCNEGINLNFRAGYRGGSAGDEFPNELRRIMLLTGDFTIAIDGGNPAIIISQIIWNGNTFNVMTPGNPVTVSVGTDIYNGFTVPDKTQFLDRYYDMQIRATGDCSIPDNTLLPVNYTVNYYHNVFAVDSPCFELNEENIASSVLFRNGAIETEPSNPDILTYSGTSIDGSSASIEICVNADGPNADIAWIQFTYPTGGINILQGGVEGTVCEMNSYGFTIEYFPIDGGITQVGDCITFDYEILSCEYTEFPLYYEVGKVCAVPGMTDTEVLDAAVCDPESCLYPGEITIEIGPSGLTSEAIPCVIPDDPCGDITYALLIENPAGGTTFDVTLDLDLPMGMTLVAASFEHPFGVATAPCDGTPTNDITFALIDGPVVLIDELEGVQTSSSDADRRILVHVTVRFDDCPNESLPAQALRFTVSGTRNCGEQIINELDQYHDLVANWFLDFDAVLQFEPEVELNCESTGAEGVATLNITWDPIITTLPPGQTLELLTFASSCVSVPTSVMISYGQEQVAIPFTHTGEPCCDALISARLITESEFQCAGEVCSYSEVVALDVLSFEIDKGPLAIETVKIEDDLCELDVATVLTTVTAPTDELNGTTVTVTLFCDDGSGMPTGTPFFTTTHVLNLSPVSGSFEEVIEVNPATSQIIDDCGGNIVVVVRPEGTCACFELIATADACCQCREFDIQLFCFQGNLWLRTLPFSPVPTGGEILFIGGIPSSMPYGTPSVQLPTFTVPPTAIQVTIESNRIPCIVNTLVDQGGAVDRSLLADCEQVITIPFDQCSIDPDFTYEIEEIDNTWVVHLDGSAVTNTAYPYYYWSVDGSIVSGLTTPSTHMIFDAPGVYTICMHVSGSFSMDCTDASTESCTAMICKTISITNAPDACWVHPNFTYSVDDHRNVTFSNLTTYNGNSVDYYWDFGDRSSSTAANPTHQYSVDGQYLVSLRAVAHTETETCDDNISMYISTSSDGRNNGDAKNSNGKAAHQEFFRSTVYPNPAKESLIFEWTASTPQSGVVEIYNISGQLIHTGSVKTDEKGQNSLRIDVDKWAAGMYLLKFEGEHDSAVHRFIVD